MSKHVNLNETIVIKIEKLDPDDEVNAQQIFTPSSETRNIKIKSEIEFKTEPQRNRKTTKLRGRTKIKHDNFPFLYRCSKCSFTTPFNKIKHDCDLILTTLKEIESHHDYSSHYNGKIRCDKCLSFFSQRGYLMHQKYCERDGLKEEKAKFKKVAAKELSPSPLLLKEISNWKKKLRNLLMEDSEN